MESGRKSSPERAVNSGTRMRRGWARRAVARLMLVVFLVGSTPLPVMANGTDTALGNATTTYGSGEFTGNTGQLTEYTQHTDHAILEWQTDIQQPADHSLEFRQAEDFVILNRSPGERASDFWGRVVCDSTCVFVNRAGINFQDGSFVDVGQVIAAGGELSNADFLADQYRFTNLGGRVTNSGWMQGGGIALLGRSVANFGHIETPSGSFIMAAGDDIWLRDHDSPIVIHSTAAGPRDFAEGPAVENAGTIHAGTGSVRLAAGDMLSFAIRNTGSIRAGSIHLEGGQGGLVEVSGTLDASNLGPENIGGQIDVLGDFVSVQAGALLDASGLFGGGRIRVGGDLQGRGDLRNARATFVHRDARLVADATEQGDGGTLIVWADETAQVLGGLSARGGPLGGSGGFAETSGKRWLHLGQAPDLRARSGLPGDLGGNWLIDPNDIEIVPDVTPPPDGPVECEIGAGPQCLDPGLSDEQLERPLFQFNGGPVVRPTVDNSEIQAGFIVNALEQGISVTLLTQTIDAVQGSQEGNITVSAAINPMTENAAPGSEATLALLAANHLEINYDIGVDIGVEPDPSADDGAASDLVLNLILTAGDPTQSQGPVDDPDNQVPNLYRGTLAINCPNDVCANLDSAGGSIVLDGVEVTSAENTTITTRGGALSATTFAGDIHLEGDIDTTTPTQDDEGNAQLGGSVTLISQAAQVPNSEIDPEFIDPESGEFLCPDGVCGGGITLEGNTMTDGGSVSLVSVGGVIDVRGLIDTSIVEAPATPVAGGEVEIRSSRTEFSPLSEDDPTSLGGVITISDGARVLTDGGNAIIGPDVTSASAAAFQIVINGEIDTQGAAGERSGGVFLEVSGEGSSITVADASPGDPNPAQIITGGGVIQSVGTGSFLLVDAVLDATSPGGLEASDIGIFHTGDVRIVENTPGSTRLAADQSIQITPAGQQGANGNMTFEGAPEIAAEEILLEVGDGHGGESLEAAIDLGSAVFRAQAGAEIAPLRFSLLQESAFNTDSAAPNIAGVNLAGMEQLTFSASDGILTVGNPDLVSGANLELRLRAGEGVEVTGPFSDNSVKLLELDVEQAFLVGETLAMNISGAAQDLVISAGTPATPPEDGDPSLVIAGSLFATESIVLQAGSDGQGDLAFDESVSEITLGAPSLTLWAGNGDSEGDARVRSEPLAFETSNVTFENGAGGRVDTFVLRQDAAITDDQIPDRSRFTGGVAGIDYTLRSDGENTGTNRITLGDHVDDHAALEGTRLSLHAYGGIDLSGIDGTLPVESLDIGGLGDFTYTEALDSKISFTDPQASRLVVRAGLASPGILRFDGDMTLQADEIRLVAGDGVGGNAGEESSSSIALDPSSGAAPVFESLSGEALEFVYRQDGSITQADLPTLETHFGGTEPGRLAIRSDDGFITLDTFPSSDPESPPPPPILQASETLVLSAPEVALVRTDGGGDLVLDEILQAGPGATALQIRADTVSLAATDEGLSEPSGSTAQVLPGDKVRLTLFDADAAAPGSAPLVPSAFDFDALPAEAPGLISVNQDGDLFTENSVDSNFINPLEQLGAAGNAALNTVLLTSRYGSITITPTSVAGADLTLALDPVGGAGSPPRDVNFDGAAFDLDKLFVDNPFAWTVERAGNEVDLSIRTEGRLQLRAGLLGEGDLDFEGNVTLDANTLLLGAGNDPLNPDDNYPDPPSSESKPVVNVRDAGGAAAVTLKLHDLEGSPASLQIRQHGSLLDETAAVAAELEAVSTGDPVEAYSLIPLMDQIHVVDVNDDDTRLDQLQLDSVNGDIRIDRFIDYTNIALPAPTLDANNILLGAGIGPDSESRVRLAQDGGHDLDLSPLNSGYDFESFAIFASNIEFAATGAGVIKAENPDLLLLGSTQLGLFDNLILSSPSSLLFEQDASFHESESGGGCDAGCLPNPVTQLGPTGADQIDYTLRSHEGSIFLDDTLFNKLAFSNLTLGASNPDAEPDVTILASPASPDFDLILESLTVGEDENAPIDILFEAPELSSEESSSENSELAILTLGDQTYNGSVTVDGRAELTGDVVHFASTIDAADNPHDADPDELVIGVRGQALIDGDVGVARELELLRVNFDPTPQSDPAQIPTLGFGGESSQTVRAQVIEVINGGDLLADFEKAHFTRIPLASTIFKQTGDLYFVADRFSMGEGEKLSVGGSLSITARTDAGGGLATLGDLSALDIVVDADTIEIQRRAAGQYIDMDGVIRPDGGVDYVGNSIDFQGEIVLTGTGDNPVFGIPDPRATPPWMLPYSTFQISPGGQDLTLADLGLPPGFPSLVDLHPTGGSRDDPSTMFIESEHVPTPAAWLPAPWLPFNHDAVEELGIDVQPMSEAEYMSQLRGAGLIDDVGQELNPWDGRPLRVSDARVDGTEAARAVELMNELFGPRGGRARRVRASLQDALDQYLRTSGARRVVGFELRRFVKNRPSSLFGAYTVLEDLDTLFALHRGLGLTPGEYRPIQARWLEAIRPEGITTRELAEAIQPSRYVRGSDVLDIFGE